ncbi:hypothetical protein F4678DRAFT_66777 [Xylaria arbuscula]|nr:hypothetical protein F4678DRAFT_66777 [Xylaria arbuscula]
MLRERLGDIESALTSEMDMWTQEASLEQAAAATRSARTSGQLAKIATVVVPCTIVASIFSMNGPFAAGEDLFYIYWTISIPVTVGLLCWVLYEDVKKMGGNRPGDWIIYNMGGIGWNWLRTVLNFNGHLDSRALQGS